MKSKFLIISTFLLIYTSVFAVEQDSDRLDVKKLTFAKIIQYKQTSAFNSPEHDVVLKFQDYLQERVKDTVFKGDSYTEEISNILIKYTDIPSGDLLLQHVIGPWIQNMTVDQFVETINDSKSYLANTVDDMNKTLEKTETAESRINDLQKKANELNELYSNLNSAYNTVYQSDYFKTLYKKKLFDQVSIKTSYDKSTNEIVISVINHSDIYDLIDVNAYFEYVNDGEAVHKTKNITIPMSKLLKKDQKHEERLPCGDKCKNVINSGGNVKLNISIMNIYSDGLIYTISDIDSLDETLKESVKYKSILEQDIPNLNQQIKEKEHEIQVIGIGNKNLTNI
jgi:hypothetical protein